MSPLGAHHIEDGSSLPISRPGTGRGVSEPNLRLRFALVGLAVCGAFAAISGQLVRLALVAQSEVSISVSDAVPQSFARPDLVDRNGRLLATDIASPSLYADPSIILDRDEAVEKLLTVFPDLDAAQLRASLSDRTRRFVWIRRGLPPLIAQHVHDLGLPGLAFRNELKRTYPMGTSAGHVIGSVNIDNKGLSGIESYVDTVIGVEGVLDATRSGKAAVRLSLDLGVQHSLESELASALNRYQASAASGLVMDVKTGEVLGSASLPGVDPSRPHEAAAPERLDRLTAGIYELGSIFKIVTLAMALEDGKGVYSLVDTTAPLIEGRFTIKDLHPLGRPMTVAEVFTHSSNTGAAMLALEAGPERQHQFLSDLGLLSAISTERGGVAPPIVPQTFDRISQITVAYGHGIAVAPLQFAAAAASLINGGVRVEPKFTFQFPGTAAVPPVRVIKAETSARLNDLMRLNVTGASGTGRRADVPGYNVGGKTGTAEMPGRNGYQDKAVISSFLAAFPMEKPKYLVMVSLFEPKATPETHGEITAGLNAAPTAGRIIARIGPQLGLMPAGRVAEAP
ncbi:MAG: penicillin-binding protein 2 [Hyphomicrobium sp.]